jgi:hypothetical protein
VAAVLHLEGQGHEHVWAAGIVYRAKGLTSHTVILRPVTPYTWFGVITFLRHAVLVRKVRCPVSRTAGRLMHSLAPAHHIILSSFQLWFIT